MTDAKLSGKDRDILEAIFNPNQMLTCEFLSEDRARSDSVNGHNVQESENDKCVRNLEVLAVRKAEEGDIEGALSCLNEAMRCSSNDASLFNNRAQVFLLKGDQTAASSDLDMALDLCNYQGKVAGQALTQQALINRVNGDDQAAFEKFSQAAELGNSFAKSQVAKMNPYAALCNQMLSQAISQLRGNES